MLPNFSYTVPYKIPFVIRFTFQLNLDSLQLRTLKAPNGKKLEDEAALLVSQVGENVSLKRALCLNVTDDLLVSGCTHPTIPGNNYVNMGKYASVLVYKAAKVDEKIEEIAVNEDNTDIEPRLGISEIAKQLGQHIIGTVETEHRE